MVQHRPPVTRDGVPWPRFILKMRLPAMEIDRTFLYAPPIYPPMTTDQSNWSSVTSFLSAELPSPVPLVRCEPPFINRCGHRPDGCSNCLPFPSSSQLAAAWTECPPPTLCRSCLPHNIRLFSVEAMSTSRCPTHMSTDPTDRHFFHSLVLS